MAKHVAEPDRVERYFAARWFALGLVHRAGLVAAQKHHVHWHNSTRLVRPSSARVKQDGCFEVAGLTFVFGDILVESSSDVRSCRRLLAPTVL